MAAAEQADQQRLAQLLLPHHLGTEGIADLADRLHRELQFLITGLNPVGQCRTFPRIRAGLLKFH
ncbi:hypothetical protein MBOE_63250 [Mycolicibacterium boenickei]|uniref:Uncharacterized protein n=1 Tax=Mycolicibacterium boenickei TaxID=146017 RepID=A0ABN5ZNG3_9MYCO|nr:hypothetical protein MBOE_63250 [Mycolicibacterium boenickei]